MFYPPYLSVERCATLITLERFLTTMDQHVHLQVVIGFKLLVTNVTLVFTYSSSELFSNVNFPEMNANAAVARVGSHF